VGFKLVGEGKASPRMAHEVVQLGMEKESGGVHLYV
jgi:hypothetical protein